MSTATLQGTRLLVPVTSTRNEFAQRLTAAGAHVAPAEFLQIAPAADPAQLHEAVAAWCAGDYDWLAVTSRNAVAAMATAASALGSSLAAPQPQARVATVGDGTRAACEQAGLTVTLTPQPRWDARALVAEFPPGPGRVLAPLGNLAAPVLPTGLAKQGWEVDVIEAYRTVAGAGLSAAVRAELMAGGFDAVVLTSGSVAERFAASVPRLPARTRVVAIGDTTAAAARVAGVHVSAVAAQASYDGVVDSLVASLKSLTSLTAQEVSP